MKIAEYKQHIDNIVELDACMTFNYSSKNNDEAIKRGKESESLLQADGLLDDEGGFIDNDSLTEAQKAAWTYFEENYC